MSEQLTVISSGESPSTTSALDLDIVGAIKAKPRTVLQAQLATYANRDVAYNDQSSIDKKNRLLTTLSEDGTGVGSNDEYDEYLAFMREVGGNSRSEVIQDRVKILEAYGQFQPVVDILLRDLKDSEATERPDFLGKGRDSKAFKIEKDGKQYAVRVPHEYGSKAVAIDEHVAAAVLSREMSGLEQLVAASYESGVTISELMAGKEVAALSLEEIRGITQEQINDLIDLLKVAHKKGISIDPSPENLFYDKQKGFGVIDSNSFEARGYDPSQQSLGDVIGVVAQVFVHSALESVIETKPDQLELAKTYKAFFEKFTRAIEEKLDDADQKSALVRV